MKHTYNKKISFSLCITTFMFLSILSVTLLSPHKAQAQFVPVGDVVNFEFHSWNFLKENALDGVVFAAVKQTAQQLVANMTDWVASGFEGAPAFVQNEGLLIRDFQDQVVLDLLTEETANLYSEAPFRDALLGSVAEQYTETYSSEGYTLDRSVDDVDAFLEGDFLEGGWDGWYELTQNPNNNFLGAYQKTQDEVQNRTAVAQDMVRTELDRGDGFFSLRDAGGNIVTPGKIIEGQLDFNLGSGMRQLEAADEYSEVISASITALSEAVIQQGITEASDSTDDALDAAGTSVRNALSNQEEMLNIINSIEESSTATPPEENPES